MRYTGSELDKVQAELDALPYSKLAFKENHEINNLGDIIWICCKPSYVDSSATTFVLKNGKKSKRHHCDAARSRSYDDIYRLAKTYIPDITFRDVWTVLDRLEEEKYLLGQYCYVVKKHVLGTFRWKLNMYASAKEKKVNFAPQKSHFIDILKELQLNIHEKQKQDAVLP